MKFLRGVGYFLLGWLLASIVASAIIGAMGARATTLGDLAQLTAALAGGIAMLIYQRNNRR